MRTDMGSWVRPHRWIELDRRQRRLEIVSTIIAVAVTWTILFGAYYLMPFTDRTGAQAAVRLLLGIALFAGVLVWQLRRVSRADFPVLRAAQALSVAIPFYLLIFAVLYLSLSQASTTRFSEPLDHTSAVYLVITIFSTVGFGDITPEGDVAQIVTSIQMLLNLVVIGAVVRLLTLATKAGLDGSDGTPPPSPAGPASGVDA